jgi:hypothetical protein
VTLAITGNVSLRFRDHSYRWINLKHFAFEVGVPDEAVLNELFAHRQFADGYIGGGPGAAAIHGPYQLTAITPGNYRSIRPDEATAWLDDFCALFDSPPTGPLASDIDAVARQRLRQSDSVLRLDTLGKAAQHESGWVLHEFRELIAIRRDAGELTLLVMGID